MLVKPCSQKAVAIPGGATLEYRINGGGGGG